MMKHRTRIYLGAVNITIDDIQEALKWPVQAWTAYQTWGAWEGELEPSWVIEIIDLAWTGAKGIEALVALAKAKGESAVLVTADRIKTELIPTVPKKGGEDA